MSRPRTLVICPGRGSYAAQELGTLTRRRAVPGAGRILDDLLPRADAMRRESELLGLAELDSASRFQASKHLPGPNAGPMIAFCSMVDRKLIPEDRYEVIGVLGNSMGWYTSLEAAGALGFEDAFRLIQTMSSSQGDKILGGQMIVPFVDENWRLDARRRDEILTVVRDARLETDAAFVSIELGGYLVVAGDDSALRIFEEELPKSKIGNHEYPFRLAFHAAFHTPLMIEASRYGRAMLSHLDWRKPQYPLVDGSGRIHECLSARVELLRDYTLGEQVLQTYDFTRALRVALRELAPDLVVLLGPGDSLGGAIGQSICLEGYRGIVDKASFLAVQKGDTPILLSMGRENDLARLRG